MGLAFELHGAAVDIADKPYVGSMRSKLWAELSDSVARACKAAAGLSSVPAAAAARGFERWAGKDFGPAARECFARERLFGAAECDPLFLTVFAQCLVEGSAGSAKAVSRAAASWLAMPGSKDVSDLDRAWTLLAQCSDDPIMGRDRAMDDAWSMALAEAALGRLDLGFEISAWARAKAKTWGSLPGGAWLGGFFGLVPGAASADLGSVGKVLEGMEADCAQRGLRAWEAAPLGGGGDVSKEFLSMVSRKAIGIDCRWIATPKKALRV